MRFCHSEAMKAIKELEEQKSKLLTQEENRAVIVYLDADKKIKTNYSYSKTRAEVDKLDAKIRKIKHALAVANCKVTLEGFNVTIGEALVYLAQLQNKLGTLSELSSNEILTCESRYDGKVYYKECQYDVEAALADEQKTREEISRLQIALDRANLNSFIEVEI